MYGTLSRDEQKKHLALIEMEITVLKMVKGSSTEDSIQFLCLKATILKSLLGK